ncbi:hypothetical protein GCM10010136_26860 [Limoniibacter endophyticus]|uniref:Uncharacterized protein n=1 Tax=Limoniibacter endophyticus TaxID=1565040 RepID=A0A8J3GIC8_9HYPH|nr:hypothetical protein GCM10010136_26860 [Limoniibacter endophyticus]
MRFRHKGRQTARLLSNRRQNFPVQRQTVAAIHRVFVRGCKFHLRAA